MLRRLVASLLLVGSLAAPALAQDAADLVVRLGRLENQTRQLVGQIEQLQNENRQLKDQLRKFQEDVEFRFQDGRGGASAQASGAPRPPSEARPAEARPAEARPSRRGDAFDPGSQPSAPGAPRPLGTTLPSAALPSGAVGALPPAGAPSGGGVAGTGPTIGGLIEDADEAPPGVGAPLDIGRVGAAPPAPVPAPRPAPPAAPSVAATSPTGDARADYDAAYAYLLQKQYEQAEMGFRQFLQSHPRDRLVPDATFWLGESYLGRGRNREAAEQFLKISTEHARSAKAPDALLKLGVALSALGARDQACATFAELGRKYPQASALVKQGADREQKRARCTA